MEGQCVRTINPSREKRNVSANHPELPATLEVESKKPQQIVQETQVTWTKQKNCKSQAKTTRTREREPPPPPPKKKKQKGAKKIVENKSHCFALKSNSLNKLIPLHSYATPGKGVHPLRQEGAQQGKRHSNPHPAKRRRR